MNQPPHRSSRREPIGHAARGRENVDRPASEFSSLSPSDLPQIRALVSELAAQASLSPPSPTARGRLIDLLDAVRRRRFVQSLSTAQVDGWTEVVLRAIDGAGYTLGDLLASRERTDPDTVALRVLGAEPVDVTVAELARRTRAIARGLMSVLGDEPAARVAILSGNSLESALCDLACLTNGIVNVRLPANSVAAQVEYMLRHSEARLVVVSDEEQLAKVRPVLSSLPALRAVIVLSRAAAERHGLISLDQLVAEGADVDDAIREQRSAAVRLDELASVMYTSGTTGMPKGIMFSQRNIVSKRFCRGFALPALGEGDVFLSYLPLFHTFGRWFELVGTLYWGATYVFARDPSIATLREDLGDVRPTAFLSVPKKWEELFELAQREAASDDPRAVADALARVAGGRLRTGLSAAGFLDPLVFKAVQRAGIDLCSGYGTTEGTGGITMTPPGRYRDGSIGVPLPGIEVRVEQDGELLVRGPYVMMGYLRPEEGDSGIDADGWFRTGDLVKVDADGYLWIIDRKKEIYKNRKGQTIAPQRVENLFRDFDVIKQAFLVGDRRDFNTLLIWPNFEAHPELASLGADALQANLTSLLATANRFLAPYERVVAFQVLPRALSEPEGELTPKGTFKRQIIEQRWSDLIEPMYREQHVEIRLTSCTVQVPNWLLREIGVVRGEISWSEGVLRARDRSLVAQTDGLPAGTVKLGDFEYSASRPVIDLGLLMSSPSLWIGNEGLREFLGDDVFLALSSRRREPAGGIAAKVSPQASASLVKEELAASVAGPDVTPLSLHAAAVLLRSQSPSAIAAVEHLSRGLHQRQQDVAALSRMVLLRAADVATPEIRRRALLALLDHERAQDVAECLRRFLKSPQPPLLRDEDVAFVCEKGMSDAQLTALLEELAWLANDGTDSRRASASQRAFAVGVVRLLAAYGVSHPVWYARVRLALARLALHGDPEIAARAGEELDRLQLGFRAWIGPNSRLAVDPATGSEYSWADAAAFDASVSPQHRTSILRAVSETSLVRESTFLFGRGQLLSLSDVPPGGLSVSHLGTNHGKAVFRVTVKTRAHGQHDFALNVAESQPVAQLREEIRWLLAAGAPPRLVEDFGGWYPEHGMFSEEFIPGETVDRQVDRLARLGASDRLKNLWPFIVWTAFSAHVDFWERTRRSLALEASPSNIIVPSHDYQGGARLVSISDSTPCTRLSDLISRFRAQFVEPVERAHPELSSLISPVILLSAVVEVLGVDKAIALLVSEGTGDTASPVGSFVEALRARGFTSQRLYFAIQRYVRWIAVNPDATMEAQGGMLRELWDAYGLDEVEQRYPDTRLRFFRQTVFRRSRAPIADGIESLMAEARKGPPLLHEQVREQVALLRGSVHPTPEEDYFLARMAYSHLRPDDDASLISLPAGDRSVTDLMVSMTDADGERFRVRAPISPREVARLLQLFQEASLQVSFSSEHEFLVAIDPLDRVIGGLYYRELGDQRVHMEKIVVQRQHRRKGVSDGLMQDFLRRLTSRGMTGVLTGFFRPEYMQRFGFKLEPRFEGMYRELEAPAVKTRSQRPPPLNP